LYYATNAKIFFCATQQIEEKKPKNRNLTISYRSNMIKLLTKQWASLDLPLLEIYFFKSVMAYCLSFKSLKFGDVWLAMYNNR
jgi:hypothetical protein